MLRARRSKAVLIESTLLIATLLLGGCIGMTYAKKNDSEGLVPIGGLRKYFPLSSADYPEPAATKIGEQMQSTATPEEMAAIRYLRGVTLDSVTLMNSLAGCQDCSGAFALRQTIESALAHALDNTSSSPQLSTPIKSLRLEVTFVYKPPEGEASLWLLPLAVVYGVTCGGSLFVLCPAPMDVTVKINGVAQLAQDVELQAVGIGAARRVTVSAGFDSERRAVFIALAEALKALATDLKKQVDEQCKANEASPLAQQTSASPRVGE